MRFFRILAGTYLSNALPPYLRLFYLLEQVGHMGGQHMESSPNGGGKNHAIPIVYNSIKIDAQAIDL